MHGIESSNRASVSIAFAGTVCSGAFISNRLVATARHCVEGEDGVAVVIEGVGDDARHVNAAHVHSDFDREYQPSQTTYPSLRGDWPQGAYAPDFAVIGVVGHGPPARATFPVADDSELPKPDDDRMRSLAGAEVEIYGFSDNLGGASEVRRVATMRITGLWGSLRHSEPDGSSTKFLGYTLEPITDRDGADMCFGDSGGAVVRNGRLIGVLASGDCGGSNNPDAYASFVDTFVIARADRDGDGVLNEEDNCPDRPNADQIRSDRRTDVTLGDACNPQVSVTAASALDFDPADTPSSPREWNDPTRFEPLPLLGTSTVQGSASIIGDGAIVWGETLPVHHLPFRASGYSGGTTTQHATEPEYCSCRYVRTDNDGNDIEIAEGDANLCASWSRLCQGGGQGAGQADPEHAMGWRRLTWRLPQPDGSVQSCTQDATERRCLTPMPVTHRRVFGAPIARCTAARELGCTVGDWARFWESPGQTGTLAWDYTTEDYPHFKNQTYDRLQTGREVVRARLHPADLYDPAGNRVNGFTTAVQPLDHGQPFATLYRPLYDLPRFAWRIPAVIDVWRHGTAADRAPLALLAPIQPCPRCGQ